MKEKNKKLKEGAIAAVISAVSILSFAPSVFAAGIGSSKIATGTQNLIADLTTWLMILAPIVSGALIIYFFIRRSAADEMDQRQWNKRIVTAIISCIGAVLGSVILNLVVSYYV